MKRVLIGSVILAVVAGAAVLSRSETTPPPPDLKIKVEEKNPFTHTKTNRDEGDFRFAVMGDRTGGARDGVFEKAIETIKLMQPEFVISVGDLIEGFTEDKDEIETQWKEMDAIVAKMPCPFYFVPGNHDVSNDTLVQKWKEKFGRSYYHFVYKNVLFLMLLADDVDSDRYGMIGKEQLAYCKDVLARNNDVRWTFVVMHKPLWLSPDIPSTGLLDLEKYLGDRKYTVMCGHRHWFLRTERNGRDYYMMATTGGASRLRGAESGEFDHLFWVTMKKDGPVMANLLLTGVLPSTIKTARPDPPRR